MGKHERIIQDQPPAARAPAVMEQRSAIEAELAALKLQTAEIVLAAYEGKPDGREKLAALDANIHATTFLLNGNAAAYDLAQRLDREAVDAWRAQVHADPDVAIEGISRKGCCLRCSEQHGCVITAGQQCAHPVKTGVLPVRLADNPAIRNVFAAACAKLKLKGHGA
jgi:hypothetical protein